MKAKRWPKAVWLGNGRNSGSYNGDGPFKGLQHTTESYELPGYDGGKTAPHITYHPAKRQFGQHTEFDVAARSLRNEAGGVETNRDSVIQLEIVCFSDRTMATKYAARGAIWVGDLTADHLADIREFWQFISDEYDVQMRWRGKQAFSYAEANAPGFRMTFAEWGAYNALCAHHDAPEQTHWDTGAFDWVAMLGATTIGDNMPTYNEIIADHSPDVMPDWSDTSVAEYIAAGGTSVKSSMNRPAFRFDIAWFWHKFVKPIGVWIKNHESRLKVLEAKVKALEAAAPPEAGLKRGDSVKLQ